MKLKKLLAAVTAAALAVTTMAVTSFTASAAEGEWSLVDGTAAGIVKYEITPDPNVEGGVEEAKKGITIDLTSTIDANKPADKEFRAINASYDVGMVAIGGTQIPEDGVRITTKSFELQYWWSSDKVTVTFEIEYGEPIVPIEKPSTLTKSGNVYTEKITAKDNPDSADNSWMAKATSHEIDLTELVPEGFDFADLREINVAITHVKGSNGELVINKNATGEVKKLFGQTWDGGPVENPTAKFELANGLTAENAKLTIDTHWAVVGDEITFTVTLKDKDGNVYPSTGGTLEGPGGDTEEPGDGDTAGVVEFKFPDTVIEVPCHKEAWEEVPTFSKNITMGSLAGKTFEELKTTKIKLTGVTFDNCSLAGITDSDIRVSIYTSWDEASGYAWVDSGQKVMTEANGLTFDFSTITNNKILDSTKLNDCGIQIYLGTTANNPALANFSVGDVIKINDNAGTTPEGPGDDRTYALVWEGSTDMGTDWSANAQIEAAKFAGLKEGDTISFTFTKGSADYFQFGISAASTGWPKLTSPVTNQYGSVELTTSPYSFVVNAADTAALKASGMAINGYGVTLTKVELNPDKKPAGGNDDNQGGDNNQGSGDSNQGGGSGSGSTPSAPTTSAPTTSNNPAPVSQTTVVDKILATPDSGKSTVDLGSSTKLDKLTIEAIATKGDVTIKLNVAGGAYWEINGKNVTDAKDVNLGVKVNSKQIPESKVEAFAGEKKTVQLTLSHNGDLGFTGTLNIPVGSSNNGKFANLYYYHGGKFDFVGSSPISGGRTQFAFSHASNYLIVIDDYAYGEDVSSAAGMTETTATETETNAVPYVAVLVVIAAFGTSALVLKKRLSK